MLITYAIMVLAFLPMAFMMYSSYVAQMKLGMGHSVVVSGISVMITFVLFFNLLYIPAVYFLSKDTEHFAALPLQGWEILASKFFAILIQEYVVLVMSLLPAAIAHLAHQFSIPALFGWILTGLLGPVFPLLILSAVFFFVVFLFPKLLNQTTVQWISMIAAVAFGVLIWYVSYRSSSQMADGVATAQAMPTSWVEFLPTTQGSLDMILGSGTGAFLLGFVKLVGTNVILSIAFFALFSRRYVGLALRSGQAAGKRKQLSGEQTKKGLRGTGVYQTLIKRERRAAFRNPLVFMNNVVGSFIGLIIIIGVFIFAIVQEGGLQELQRIQMGIPTLFAALGIPHFLGFLIGLYVMTMVIIFFGTTTLLTGTAVTRDAKELGALGSLPISARTYFFSKLHLGTSISLIQGLIVFICLLVITMGRLPILVYIGGVCGILLGAFFSNLVQLLVDCLHPRLHWQTMQQAVKTGVNNFVCSLGQLAIVGGCIYLLVRFFTNGPAHLSDLYWIMGIPVLVFALVTIGIFFYIRATAERRLRRILNQL